MQSNNNGQSSSHLRPPTLRQPTYDSATICPSCKRFVGPFDECPFCDTPIIRRLSTKLLRYAALIIAILGMFGLVIYSTYFFTAPEVKIKDISPTNNFAVLKISGKVAGVPSYYYNETTGSAIYFNVDDDTGIAPIKIYEPVSSILISRNSKDNPTIPMFGDFVTIKAALQYRGNDFYFILNSDRNIVVTRLPETKMNIHDIFILPTKGENATKYIGTRVAVSGVVMKITIRSYFTSIEIANISKSQDERVTVFIPNTVINLTGALPPIAVNYKISVIGALQLYTVGSRSYWEIIPAGVWDITVVTNDEIRDTRYEIRDTKCGTWNVEHRMWNC